MLAAVCRCWVGYLYVFSQTSETCFCEREMEGERDGERETDSKGSCVYTHPIKVLAMQAWQLESNPPNPHEKPDTTGMHLWSQYFYYKMRSWDKGVSLQLCSNVSETAKDTLPQNSERQEPATNSCLPNATLMPRHRCASHSHTHTCMHTQNKFEKI